MLGFKDVFDIGLTICLTWPFKKPNQIKANLLIKESSTFEWF